MSKYEEPPVLSGDLSDYHRWLGYLLMSPAWNEIFKPKVAERGKILYDKLIDPKASRKENLPDDYIRGQIAALKWMMEWPEKEMGLVANRIKEAEIMSEKKAPNKTD